MRHVLVSAVLALTLVGCHKAAPEAEAETPTARPTPTATAPVMPEEAKELTPSGAANFTQHWVNALNYANSTGDTRQLEELSSPDCEACTIAIDKIRSTYDAGGHFSGNDWKIKHLEFKSYNPDVLITLHIRRSKGEVVSEFGSSSVQIKAKNSTLYAWVSWDGDSWLLGQLGTNVK